MDTVSRAILGIASLVDLVAIENPDLPEVTRSNLQAAYELLVSASAELADPSARLHTAQLD
jgi:hypothetical protein